MSVPRGTNSFSNCQKLEPNPDVLREQPCSGLLLSKDKGTADTHNRLSDSQSHHHLMSLTGRKAMGTEDRWVS
jgi:hypothetical protein